VDGVARPNDATILAPGVGIGPVIRYAQRRSQKAFWAA
jgi:hypothetical protein